MNITSSWFREISSGFTSIFEKKKRNKNENKTRIFSTVLLERFCRRKRQHHGAQIKGTRNNKENKKRK